MKEYRLKVSEAGTVRILKRPYSLPSGFRGRVVKALVTEWEVEFWYAGRCVHQRDRHLTECGGIDYRHVVPSLLKKPGGFRQYRYLEALFPRPVFRETWDALTRWSSPRQADLAYLRILKLAATTLEEDVAAVLRELLDADQPFDDEDVLARIKPPRAVVPAVEQGQVNLRVYDRLLVAAVSR